MLRGIGCRTYNPGADLNKLLNKIVTHKLHPWVNFLVHNHDWSKETAEILRKAAGNVKIIASYRDPRDICVSLKKLHDLPIEKAIELTRASTRMHFALVNSMSPLRLQYEKIREEPRQLVQTIADYLELSVSDEATTAIVTKTSVKTHTKIMEKVAAGDESLDIISFKNTNRVFYEDKTTHISDRHIQSGKSGRWLTELSEPDQEKVNDVLLEYALKLGYQ